MRCVKLMSHDDGTFMVLECEPPAPEEMQGGQTFQSAEEAAQAAVQMLSEAGEANEMQAAMQGGYDKMMGNKAPPAGAGNQYQEM